MIDQLFDYTCDDINAMGASSGSSTGIIPIPNVTLPAAELIRRRRPPIIRPSSTASLTPPAPVIPEQKLPTGWSAEGWSQYVPTPPPEPTPPPAIVTPTPYDPCAIPIGGTYPTPPRTLDEVLPFIKNNPQLRPCFQKLFDEWLGRMSPSLSQDVLSLLRYMPLELSFQIYWWERDQYAKMSRGSGTA